MVFVKSLEGAIAQAKDNPAVMIVDLNTTALDALEFISTLKNDAETSKVNLLGYVSHVQTELKLEAQESGCDMVVARSVFAQNLPVILKRHATAPPAR